MSQTVCPECGTELDDSGGLCSDCAERIDSVDGRGQSQKLAIVIFVLLLIGIAITILAVLRIVLG